MRIIGPNCLGVMSPTTGLNATFATTIARRGTVGFISQSGALCTAILDWSLRENVGFSSFVSIGSMLDVERKLGKRLAGRTTKPASLKRIADYLVSRSVFEAAPEKETMIITGKPSRLSLRASSFIAGAVVLLLAAAGGIYYYRSTGGLLAPALQPQHQAPLVTLPRATAPLVAAPSPTLLSAPAATAEQKKGPAPGKKPASGTKKKKKQKP